MSDLSLLFLLFVVLCALQIYVLIDFFKALYSHRWNTVSGTIIYSELLRVGNGEKNRAVVKYKYKFGNTEFSGNRVSYYPPLVRGDTLAALEIVEKYEVDQAVTVYLAPNRPELCILEPGVSGAGYFSVFGVFGFLLAVMVAIYDLM